MRGCSRTIAAGATQSGCGDKAGGCYAERNGYRFAGPGLSYEGLVRMTPNGARWTGNVLLVDKHLLDPLRWERPRRIFTTSVSDPFHERFSNETIAVVYGVIAASTRHTHQLLTKRAKRAREWYGWLKRNAAACNAGRGMSPAAYCFAMLQKYVDHDKRGSFSDHERKLLSRADVVESALSALWPLPNLWLIASTEHQAAADDRVPDLLAIPAAVRGLSCEPLIGEIDLRHVQHASEFEVDALTGHHGVYRPLAGRGPHIDWVIIGAESGPVARPAQDAWFESIVEQCTAADVAVFIKQMVIDGRLWKDAAAFPSHLQRREFPR